MAEQAAKTVQRPRRGDDWIPEIEGLRGILAWTVVAGHVLICSGWFGPSFRGSRILNEISESAVDLFILVSGFAITRLLTVQRESYSAFSLRRACRIFPAYWLALGLGIALNGWLAGNYRHLAPSADAEAYARICDIGMSRPWTDGALHLLLLQGLAPATQLPAEPYTFLGVAWSLSLEWQFYCVAPLAFTFTERARWGGLLLAFASAIGALFSAKLTSEFSNAFLPVKAAFFFVGALSYRAVEKNPHAQRVFRWLFLSCILLILFWQFGSGRVIEAWLPAALWFFVLAAVRFRWFNILRRFLDSTPMQFLGRISYSTYLFHVPVITVLQVAIWRWLNPRSETQLLVATALGGIPATLLVSWLCWRAVERPFQRLGRSLAR